MQHIITPPNKRLVWYLSMEEYLAQHISDTENPSSEGGVGEVRQESFFTWIVPPTVIFGRHQVMEDEVNMDYCRANGVQMYRRKSGGGCVYSDAGNLMLSYITPDTRSEQVFQHYLDSVAGALQQLGFAAAKSEHNDVLVGDRKVSGNACYALPTGTIVHGTMLFDVDFAALQQAITPSREKLSKHGVQSVRQRVANLKDLAKDPHVLNDLKAQVALSDIHALSDYFISSFCTSSRTLTPEEISAIDALEQTYLAPSFIAGK
mgnify:FL=1